MKKIHERLSFLVTLALGFLLAPCLTIPAQDYKRGNWQEKPVPLILPYTQSDTAENIEEVQALPIDIGPEETQNSPLTNLQPLQQQRPWYQRTLRENKEVVRENLAPLKNKIQATKQFIKKSADEAAYDFSNKTPQELAQGYANFLKDSGQRIKESATGLSRLYINSVKTRVQEIKNFAAYVTNSFKLPQTSDDLYSIVGITPTTSQEMIVTKLNNINQILATEELDPKSRSLLELKKKALIILENPKDRAAYDQLRSMKELL